jgi:hypothetical protein
MQDVRIIFGFAPCGDSLLTNSHRVLNDIERTRLSCGCVIWILTLTLPAPLPSVSSNDGTQEDLLTKGGGEGMVGEEPSHMTVKKLGPL